MVHFPGVVWWREIDDMPFETWDQCYGVIQARVAAQRQQQQKRGVTRRG